ncbi:redoxin domain-containing protein [Geothrix sp. 21YS21S-2]|uniref:redoxin domain-containing protein n=1 Tax=Geothrix sp. 21YS21S-2 TaxID=3068893 RepID=UPI0027BAEDB4|nr:redoxin domain-containing protein [Geothrix sp. 21YS21S-2]
MRKLALFSAILISTSLAAPARAARVGEKAPDFTAVDSNGVKHSLSEYAGRITVLEWHNQGCPFVKKFYDSGSMQKLQKAWAGRGVAWLTVISSAPGKQGHVTGSEENAYLKKMDAAPAAVLLDPTGQLGHLYDAKTSPHMFIIDPKGTLIYNGAIDDQPTPDPASLAVAKNYVAQALTEAMDGKPVSVPTSRPYGCSVKYAD